MTLLRAVRQPRYLATSWPWRALAYASTTGFAVVLVWLALAAFMATRVIALGARFRGHRWEHLST